MAKLKTAVEAAAIAEQTKIEGDSIANGDSPALAVVTQEQLAGLAAARPDFGYYFPMHGPPTRLNVVKLNESEGTGWDEVAGIEIKSPITVDIGYPDGKIVVRKCPIANGPLGGHFVFGALQTRKGPEDLRGEEFPKVELGRNLPLN